MATQSPSVSRFRSAFREPSLTATEKPPHKIRFWLIIYAKTLLRSTVSLIAQVQHQGRIGQVDAGGVILPLALAAPLQDVAIAAPDEAQVGAGDLSIVAEHVL